MLIKRGSFLRPMRRELDPSYLVFINFTEDKNMRTDIILDLGLYFISNTSGIKNKERLNDFIVFSEILKLQRFQDSLTDSEYYIKNNKIMVLSLDEVLQSSTPLEEVFFETEYAYDNFSVATTKLLDEAMVTFDNQPDVVKTLLSKSIPDNKDLDIFSDEFYYCVLKQTDLSEENIVYIIDRIKHFQYIYNTFAV